MAETVSCSCLELFLSFTFFHFPFFRLFRSGKRFLFSTIRNESRPADGGKMARRISLSFRFMTREISRGS